MSDECMSVIREVERLVTAPYVPSLQDLHEIAQNTPSTIINSWASCKQCQIGLLVDVLVEGLSRSSVALDLLCAFGSAPAFRDALIERYPAILDKFLEQAIEVEEPKYTLACTVLLSSPLPTNFIAPARLAPFITKLVSQMAENPREETISPLYKVITGLQNSPQILNEVPAETMTNFQTELTKILRSLDDHMGNLLCLATFARIVKSDIKHGPQTQPPSWLENIQHFFGPKRGLKSLDLVVLRVILACSANCGSLGAGKAAESVRLAIEICDAVELQRKQAWIAGNSSKIAKLCEKVTRDGIGQEVQMMGITFLTCIIPGSGLPSEIPRLGLHGLVSMGSRQILEIIPSELIPRLVEATAIAVGEPAICSLLNYTFSVLKAEFPGGENTISTVRLAGLFLSGLRKLEGSMTRKLASSLGKETTLRLLDHFPKQPTHSQCQGSIVCYTELATSENQLFLDALDFCSSPDVDNDSLAIPRASIIAAFTRQVRRSLSADVCGFAAPKTVNFRDPFFLPDHRQILPNAYPRRDWKAGIAETVTSNSRNLHKDMTEKVQEICHDLERRCYDTEGPLRVVEEERDGLRFETEQLKQERVGLQDQIQQASGTISDLQHEMTCLEEHAQSSSARVDDLSAKLEATQDQLKEQQQSSEETARGESEKARTKELELTATLTEKEDQLEELQGEMDEQRTENGEIRKTLDCVSKEKAVSLENGVSLRQEIARLEESVDSCKRTMAERGDEIQRLFKEGENAKRVTEILQKQLGEAAAESNGLKSALAEADEHFGCEMETVKQQYELRLSNANADTVKQKEENRSLQSAMQTAASNASKELQTKDRKTHRLEKKVQSLHEERERTAREFSEAEQHLGRLMNVMGFQRATESDALPKHRSTLGGPSPGATMQQKILSDDADTQTQPDFPVGESFESTNSTTSGPTPKRPRGNPCLQCTPSAPPRSAYSQKTKVLPTQTRMQRQERKPLTETDKNSPLKSQRHGISKGNGGETCESQVGPTQGENYTQGIDFDADLDFSKGSLFTSTCFSEANRQLDSFGS